MATRAILEYHLADGDESEHHQTWGLPARCTDDTPYFHIELDEVLERLGVATFEVACCIDTDLVGRRLEFSVDRSPDPAHHTVGYQYAGDHPDLVGMQFNLREVDHGR